MTIPNYQQVMLPLLGTLRGGTERSIADCRRELAVHFELSESELAELLPSGRTPKFNSRVNWGKTYLEKALAIKSTSRGVIQITERGSDLLAEGLTDLTTNQLAVRSPELREWIDSYSSSTGGGKVEVARATAVAQELPPAEFLDISFRRYKESVQEELLERIGQMPPEFFERLVVDLLLRLGYGGASGSGIALGKSGDHGVDGVIYQDKLGLDLLYVQAKRWGGSVGGSIVREFAGALSAHRANKGVIITTSTFTRDAWQDAERMGSRIVLIDGLRLSELLYETGLGLVTEATLAMKRLDSDYFEGA